jgi:putative endonuclease
MYCVYLLKHPDNVSYVGITTDIERRLNQHNQILPGGAKFTKTRSPNWTLEETSKLMTKSDALKLEHKVKKEIGLEKRKNIIKTYLIS